MLQIDKNTTVGFVGLGLMGTSMALCLLRAGWRLQVYARRDLAAAPLIDAGAKRATTLAELGRACRVVVLCLSDEAAVEEVLYGQSGLADGLAPDSVVVDTSTIAATAAQGFAQQLAAKSLSYIDAPVSGGHHGAKSGSLACMMGGRIEMIEALRAVMSAFCKTISHAGEVGAGQTVKACNQVAAAGALLGVADAITLARAQGVDPRLMRDVLLGGTARSFVLDKDGQRIIAGDFEPGFRARLMLKDLRIALESARSAGAQLQGAALAERLLDELCESGGAELDWAALGRLVQQKQPS